MSLPYLQPYLGLSNGLNTLHAAGGPGGGVGGWIELGRSSGAVQLDVSSLPNKRYYMILTHKPSGSAGMGNYLNGDTGSNYASRYSSGGGADTTGTGQTALFGAGIYFGDYNEFMVSYIANYSSKEKLAMMHLVGGNTTGAGNAPQRFEDVSKWANTSNAINRIQTQGTMTDANSQMVILGYDPLDSHTNNYWEELASVDWTSGNTMSTGTIPARKYLWIQGYFKSATPDFVKMIFNNDTGANYSYRYNANGGTDGTSTSLTRGAFTISGVHSPAFTNHFFINNASTEKLGISHVVHRNNTGAGNAPERIEQVDKWSNTSNQITRIDAIMNSGNFSAGYLRVYGAN